MAMTLNRLSQREISTWIGYLSIIPEKFRTLTEMGKVSVFNCDESHRQGFQNWPAVSSPGHSDNIQSFSPNLIRCVMPILKSNAQKPIYVAI